MKHLILDQFDFVDGFPKSLIFEVEKCNLLHFNPLSNPRLIYVVMLYDFPTCSLTINPRISDILKCGSKREQRGLKTKAKKNKNREGNETSK